MNKQRFIEFLDKWSIPYKDLDLIIKAFTHSSYANLHGIESNERLEFLGDAVLELASSKFLFDTYQELPEGDLTKRRAKNVCEPALYEYAKKMELSKYILLSKGEDHNGGRKRPAILADAFEALLGAIYLDMGMTEVVKLLNQVVFPQILEDSFDPFVDYKSTLQELIQTDSTNIIEYQLLKEDGPAHKKTFETGVFLDGIRLGKGIGKSKKEAEQNAAKMALEKLAGK